MRSLKRILFHPIDIDSRMNPNQTTEQTNEQIAKGIAWAPQYGIGYPDYTKERKIEAVQKAIKDALDAKDAICRDFVSYEKANSEYLSESYRELKTKLKEIVLDDVPHKYQTRLLEALK